MTRRYYSSRNNLIRLTLDKLSSKLRSLFLLFRSNDYLKGKAGITDDHIPNSIKHEAALSLNFDFFSWLELKRVEITEDHIFDAIEFLYDHVSKPGEWSEIDYGVYDYRSYDDDAGQEEFKSQANVFLADYKDGYELTIDGHILALDTDGLKDILNAEIIPYDETNVDSKVRNAITKWRNRQLILSEKREAIKELAEVFEWLKDVKILKDVLDKKDEADIFNIANNFHIRHHKTKQKTNYDPKIWYPWIFHFYLATYHASIRLLIRKEKGLDYPVNQETFPGAPSEDDVLDDDLW